MNFSYEEINLMALYNTGSRERLIEVLTEMKTYGWAIRPSRLTESCCALQSTKHWLENRQICQPS